ncbi:serine carboxypeptidase s28 domain-containing protein [Ditylenchus destructor]|nr:serine carboxypeptidase s28 domain-containing protein [Ditylenchus destructor]
MRFLLLCVVVVISCIITISADEGTPSFRLSFAPAGLPLFGKVPNYSSTANTVKELVKEPAEQAADSNYEKFFDQDQDHFDSNNKNTFKQRYFVNKQWKSSTNGAVHFLFLEGEDTATSDRVADATLPQNALAKDVGATVWSLEHRWRGKSQPYKRTFAINLASSLSTAQAIEDIVTFINATNKNSGEKNPKWVLFGSNYGAVLALWFRQKYPSITIGAVADSPAIQPTTDFYQFESFIEQSYANYSYECWHGIKFSAIAIRNEIQYEGGVNHLNNELKLQPFIDDSSVDYKSLQNLHHNLVQLFELPVVYNKVNIGPYANCCGIDDVCKIMSNETVKDIDRVYLLAQMLYTGIHGNYSQFPGLDNSYELMVQYLNNTAHGSDDTDQPTARSWLWQQCHEFGQFISTDNGRGLFSATVPNDYFIALCTDAFGTKLYSYTSDTLKDAIKNTTTSFNTSQIYSGKNALIFYGARDPLQLLGVKTASDSSSVLHVIDEVGRNAILRPSYKNEPWKLGFARRNVLNMRVKRWVTGKGNNKMSLDELENYERSENAHAIDGSMDDVKLPGIKNMLGSLDYENSGAFVSVPHPEVAKRIKRADHSNLFRGSVTFAKQLSRAAKRFSQHQKENGDSNAGRRTKRALETLYIVQDVDHFDQQSNLKFIQRYFKNAAFQRDLDAPRFLMAGGEVMIDWTYVDDDLFHYYRWAKDFKAVMYALEHRFFGYSSPFSNTTVSSLRFLTTEQVLGDMAVFVNTMNVAENNTAPKWILFGGSYAGNLVSAFRVRYPDLSLGGVVSSAPLQAKTDIFEYMQMVEQDVRKYGQTYCPSALRSYYAWMRTNLNSKGGRMAIKEALCLPNHWDENYIDENDAQLFIAELVYAVDEVMQLDNEKHDIINWMCQDLKQFVYERNAKKQKRFKMPALDAESQRNKFHGVLHGNGTGWTIVKPDDRSDFYEHDSDYTDEDDSQPSRYSDSEEGEPEVICPEECDSLCREPVSYNRLLAGLQNIYRDFNYDVYWDRFGYTNEARLWLWITCTQWGFAHSTNYGYNLFESGLPVNYVINLCGDVFGQEFNRNRIDEGVRLTNLAYGGRDRYKGRSVVFVNHSEDPWSALGVSQPVYPKYYRNTTTISVEGTTHCADMFREYEHDVQRLKEARKTVKKQIVRWIRRSKEASVTAP